MDDAMREALALFLRYDGERFHLVRDGLAARYDAFGVPPELEASWRRDLPALRLAWFRAERDPFALMLMSERRELGHLPDVVAALPDEAGQQGQYLVYALTYWDRCAGWSPEAGGLDVSRYDAAQLGAALEWIAAGVRQVLEQGGDDLPQRHRRLEQDVAERQRTVAAATA